MTQIRPMPMRPRVRLIGPAVAARPARRGARQAAGRRARRREPKEETMSSLRLTAAVHLVGRLGLEGLLTISQRTQGRGRVLAPHSHRPASLRRRRRTG